jgi:hypothetical protein
MPICFEEGADRSKRLAAAVALALVIGTPGFALAAFAIIPDAEIKAGHYTLYGANQQRSLCFQSTVRTRQLGPFLLVY